MPALGSHEYWYVQLYCYEELGSRPVRLIVGNPYCLVSGQMAQDFLCFVNVKLLCLFKQETSALD